MEVLLIVMQHASFGDLSALIHRQQSGAVLMLIATLGFWRGDLVLILIRVLDLDLEGIGCSRWDADADGEWDWGKLI